MPNIQGVTSRAVPFTSIRGTKIVLGPGAFSRDLTTAELDALLRSDLLNELQASGILTKLEVDASDRAAAIKAKYVLAAANVGSLPGFVHMQEDPSLASLNSLRPLDPSTASIGDVCARLILLRNQMSEHIDEIGSPTVDGAHWASDAASAAAIALLPVPVDLPSAINFISPLASTIGITQDATKGWLTPKNLTEWQLVGTILGIATPTNLWLMQESGAPLGDSIGALNLIALAGGSFHQTVAGWTRKAFQTADGSGQRVQNDSGPDQSTTSAAVLMYVNLPTPPGGFRQLFEFYNAGPAVNVTADPFAAVSSGGVTALGSKDMGTADHLILIVSNATQRTVTLYTDQETLTVPWTAVDSLTFLFGGVEADAANANYMMAAMWTGPGAEMTAVEANALIALLQTSTSAPTGFTAVIKTIHSGQVGHHFHEDNSFGGTGFTLTVNPPVTVADCARDANDFLTAMITHYASAVSP